MAKAKFDVYQHVTDEIIAQIQMSNRPIKAQGFSEDACFSVINISLGKTEALDGAVTLLDERGEFMDGFAVELILAQVQIQYLSAPFVVSYGCNYWRHSSVSETVVP